MRITWLEFHHCYAAAVMLDNNKWQRLRISDSMLEQFAYQDSGPIYVPPEQRGRENIADSYLRLFRYRNGMQSAELQ